MASDQQRFDDEIKKLRDNPQAEAVVFSDYTTGIPDAPGLDLADLEQIEEALEGNHSVKRIVFYGSDLAADTAAVLGRIIAQQPELEELRLDTNDIDCEGAKALAAGIAQISNLKYVKLWENQIADEGGVAIVQALKNHSGLHELDFGKNCSIGNDTAIAGAELLPHVPKLTTFGFRDCGVTSIGAEALFEGATEARHLNLMSTSIFSKIQNFDAGIKRIQEYCQLNQESTADYLQSLMGFPIKLTVEYDYTYLTALAARVPAMEQLCAWRSDSDADQGERWVEALQSFKDYVDRMPTLDPNEPVTWENLTTKQGEFAPIDHPDTWLQFGRVIRDLNESGVMLQRNQLVEADGSASPLLNRACEACVLGDIFISENWKGATQEDFKAVLDALGERAADVPTRHGITAMLSRQEQAETRMR